MKKKMLILVGLMFCFYLTTFSVSAISLSGESYILSEGTLDLDGQTMYVNGDFLHTGGTLNLGSGNLVIAGNYYITSENGGTCSAILKMMDDGGHILVHGDFITNTTNNGNFGYNFLTAGTLEVKGDFTQKATTDMYGWASGNFSTAGSHTVILSGTGEQIVSFDSPQSSYFTNLNVTNQSGLVNFEELPIQGELQSNLISNSDINLYADDLTLNGRTITSPNLCMYGGGTLTLGNNAKIDANLLQYTGIVDLTGSAEITGNYYIQSENGGTCAAILKMINVNGYLLVGGDFITDTTNNGACGYSYLTNGTLEVKGDFSQKSTTDIYGWTSYNFSTTGNHTVIFSGTDEQIVSFESPTNSYFTILINKNPDGVIFVTEYNYEELQTVYPFDFVKAEYVEETNQINVEVTLNESLESLNGTVIISLYDEDNRLINCRIKELLEIEEVSFNGLANYTGSYILKAFYWKNMSSIKSLCNSIQTEL